MSKETPNCTKPGFCPKRNEKEYCPECGQHWALPGHTYMPGNATEPPEIWCDVTPDDERERYDPFDNSHDLPRPAGDFWENLDI